MRLQRRRHLVDDALDAPAFADVELRRQPDAEVDPAGLKVIHLAV
jgi:hypothetical protein